MRQAVRLAGTTSGRAALVGTLAAAVLGASLPVAAAAQTSGRTEVAPGLPATATDTAVVEPAGRGVLPAERWFVPALADPQAPRFSAAVMRTDLLREPGAERPPFELSDGADSGTDVVAAVSLGAVLPLLRVATWADGGLSMFVDGRVFSRFRLEYSGRDDMGQDWYIGGGLDARRGRWSGRFGLTHRSSHLGDEFVASTGAERIEFGGEQLDLLAAHEVPGVARLYAGGAWVFRSYLHWDRRLNTIIGGDRALVQLGADRTWRPWRDRRIGLHAGFDWQAAERTGWRGANALALGAGVDSDAVAGRSLRMLARFYDGPSTMGQFFLTAERAFSIELLATF